MPLPIRASIRALLSCAKAVPANNAPPSSAIHLDFRFSMLGGGWLEAERNRPHAAGSLLRTRGDRVTKAAKRSRARTTAGPPTLANPAGYFAGGGVAGGGVPLAPTSRVTKPTKSVGVSTCD